MATKVDDAPAVDTNQALLALIQEVRGEMADLREQVASQAERVPRVVPMKREDIHNAGTRRAQVMASLRGGQKADGQLEQVPVDHLGHRIPKQMLEHMGAAFQTGSVVRINPDVKREGAEDTWGDILARSSSDGYGTVEKVLWYGKGGFWKYKVKVPGLTGRSPDGFYEYELEAA